MNRFLFHSLFIAALVFSFAACQKKKDSKSPKAKPVQGQNQNQNTKPTPETDAWLNAIVKMTDETSHVYREILVRVFRGQDTDFQPQTILFVTKQALAQFATGQNVVKNPDFWETEIELKEPKKKVTFFLKRRTQRGDDSYQLSFGEKNDRQELVSFQIKSQNEVKMTVNTSQFSNLTERGIALAMHSNFQCDYILEPSQDKLMSEVRCQKIPFVQNEDKVIIGNEFFYSRQNEGVVELKGDVFTVGTRNQTVELKVAHVGKISVIEKDLYEKAEPIAVVQPAPVPQVDGKESDSSSGQVPPVSGELSGELLNKEKDSSLAPRPHAKRASYKSQEEIVQEELRKTKGPRINPNAISPENVEGQGVAPGTQVEMEGLNTDQPLEDGQLERKFTRDEIKAGLLETMKSAGISVPEDSANSDQSNENEEVDQQSESYSAQQHQEGSRSSGQFPPPVDSDLQGAPQQ